MKGLLLKDLYMIRKVGWYQLLMFAVFLALGCISQNNGFFLLWPMVFLGLLSNSLIGYEEQAGWPLYAQTMPWERRTIVTEKYVLEFVLVLLGAGVIALVQAGNSAVRGGEISPVNVFLLCISVGLLAPALSLPPVFKYGTIKGRWFYMVLIILVSAVSGVLSEFAVGSESQTAPAEMVLGVVPLVVAVIYLLSWLLSMRFYEKREL